MRLGLDIDNCIYEWEKTARFILNSNFGYDLQISQAWHWIKQRVAKEHWNWLWEEGIRDHGLFLHGNTVPGAFEALKQLDDQGHKIVLITSRPKKAANDTWAWIAYHKIPTTEVHILGPNSGGKSQVDCDLYLDDSADNYEELRAAGKMVLLMDRPWNQGLENAVRVQSWEAFVRFVEQMDQERGI